jgi:transposase
MVFYLIELRIQALSLAAWGIPTKEIAAYLGLSQRTIQDIYKRAKDRGFDHTQRIEESKWSLLRMPNELDAPRRLPRP